MAIRPQRPPPGLIRAGPAVAQAAVTSESAAPAGRERPDRGRPSPPADRHGGFGGPTQIVILQLTELSLLSDTNLNSHRHGRVTHCK